MTGTEASFTGAGAECQTAWTVWPGEKKAQGYIISVYTDLMGRHECLQPTGQEKDTTGVERQFSSTAQHMVYLLSWFWPG